jgi:outer membrane biosynthesis protein TonB
MGTSHQVSHPSIVIRIGVVMGGQLVEERRFSAARITFGESSRCTIVAPGCGFARMNLFERTERGYSLVPTLQAMAGKVRYASANSAQSTTQLQLGDRGRLTRGDVTLLFQLLPFVDVAPMRLPHGLRPSLLDRFDRRVAMVVATSLLFHGVIAGYALSSDVEAAPTILGAAEQFTLQTIDISEPEPLVQPTTATPPTTAQPGTVPPVPSVTPSSKPVTPAKSVPVAVPDDPARLHDQAVAMANMLTGGPGSDANHELPKRTVGADLNKQIDAARTKQVSIGETTNGTRDNGVLRPGTGHEPVINPDNNQTTSINKANEMPGGRVIPKVLPTPGGDDIPIDIASRITNVYRTGLVRCYRSYMAGAGEAQGRVTLKLSLTASGRVASAAADGFADELDSCIEGQMAQWHFKVPADYDGGDAVVSLQLLPGM